MTEATQKRIQTCATREIEGKGKMARGKGDDGPLPDRVVVVSGADGLDNPEAVLTAAVRPVTLGPSEGEAISILSGLKAGERVVEGPYRVLKTLQDGDKVTREADDPTKPKP